MSAASKSLLLAFFLAFVAWSSTQVYASYCVPPGFRGFITSMITMDSSPCQAVFALISHSGTLYASMVAAVLFSMFAFFSSLINDHSLPALPKPHLD
jgi:hypothetical protein